MINVRPWARPLEINEPTYKDITLEFLSIIKLNQQIITFQAYGQACKYNIEIIGRALGIYNQEESRHILYGNPPTTWPADMSARDFWNEIKDTSIKEAEIYNFAHSKASWMKDVDWRVVHHLLAHTIGQKKSSHGVVNASEIFYLYTMTHRIQIDIGYQVADFILRQATSYQTKGVYYGGYITKLLKGLQIFQQPQNDEGVPSRLISNGPFLH